MESLSITTTARGRVRSGHRGRDGVTADDSGCCTSYDGCWSNMGVIDVDGFNRFL